MPQVLIAVDKFMVDPAICREKKQWPPFEMIRNTKLEELADHPWFKLREVTESGGGGEVAGPSRRLDKGKSREIEVGDEMTVTTDTTPDVATDDVERGRQRKRRQSRGRQGKSRGRARSVRSAATVDADGDQPIPADWMPAAQDERCDRCTKADEECMVKPGRACQRCNRIKARCSLMAGVRARSRAASRAPQPRRGTSPLNAERSQSRPAKRRRASTRLATPGPSQASSSTGKMRSK